MIAFSILILLKILIVKFFSAIIFVLTLLQSFDQDFYILCLNHGGTHGATVIIVGSGLGDPSSNPSLFAFHFLLIPLGKVWIILPPAMDKYWDRGGSLALSKQPA